MLTLILIPGTQPPIPAGLVQKEQLGMISINRAPTQEQLDAMERGDLGHEVLRRLPLRLPECTFQRLRWYMYHPANLHEPATGEVPTQEEADPFAEKLTKEQFTFASLALQHSDDESMGDDDIPAMLEISDPRAAEAREMKRSGKSVMEIAKHFSEQIPTIAQWLKE